MSRWCYQSGECGTDMMTPQMTYVRSRGETCPSHDWLLKLTVIPGNQLICVTLSTQQRAQTDDIPRWAELL